MKVGISTLNEALFGALHTDISDGILKMSRFSPSQLQHFDKTLNYIKKPKKSRSCSCMNFDFYTDSQSLSFDAFCFSASSQKECFFDILEDGKLEGHFGYSEKEDRELKIKIELKPGRKRVTIYLPCLFGAEISNFEIDDGAFFEPIKKDRKIMFFGDSITQGYTTEFPSLTYSNIVTRKLDADCVNQGIGAGVFDASDLIDINFNPDIVFTAYGTNDWIHSGERNLTEKSDEYFKKLCEIFPKSEIFAILPLWRSNIEEKKKLYNPPLEFFEVHEILKEVCSRYNIITVDGLELIPHFESFFLADGTHPNNLGHLTYGNNLVKFIEERI